MPNYRRANIPGGTSFFTVNTFRRLPVLTEASVRAALCEAIHRTRQAHPFDIKAWVLLPDRLHCIWKLPEGDADFSIRWSKIKRHESGLWQRRFWEHQIRDNSDFARHVDYIHWNPVKHGLVERACEWPYSTFHRFVRDGAYSQDWGLGIGGIDVCSTG